MKILHIIAAISLATMVFASGPDDARVLNEAKKSYEAQEFQRSFELFETYLETTPESVEANFYLGLCAIELKDYDGALVAFDRVLMLDPNHAKTRLEIARVYYLDGQFELASVELSSFYATNLPPEQKLEKSSLQTFISAGLTYDSNTNNDIDEGKITILGQPYGTKEKSDTYLNLTAGLTHLYDIGNRGDWILESKGLFYLKMNQHVTQNNLALFSLSTKPIWSAKKYRVGFPVAFDTVYLDGSGYAKVLQGGIEGAYLLDERSSLESYLLLKRSYFDDDTTYDATSTLLGLKYSRAIGKDPFVFGIGASYEDIKMVRGSGLNVSADAYGLKLDVSKELYRGIIGAASYSYENKAYDVVETLFGNKRKDKESRYALGAIYPLSETSSLSTTISLVDHNSNQAPYEYDKTTVGINYLKSF